MGYKTELKNGSSVDSQRIKTFYDCWLKPLFNQDPNLVVLLYSHAEDEEFEIPEETREWFIKLAFLRDDGSFDPDFRNVILSAITLDREASHLAIERPELSKRETPPSAIDPPPPIESSAAEA